MFVKSLSVCLSCLAKAVHQILHRNFSTKFFQTWHWFTNRHCERIRFTTWWWVVFRVKSFKAAVMKLIGLLSYRLYCPLPLYSTFSGLDHGWGSQGQQKTKHVDFPSCAHFNWSMKFDRGEGGGGEWRKSSRTPRYYIGVRFIYWREATVVTLIAWKRTEKQTCSAGTHLGDEHVGMHLIRLKFGMMMILLNSIVW